MERSWAVGAQAGQLHGVWRFPVVMSMTRQCTASPMRLWSNQDLIPNWSLMEEWTKLQGWLLAQSSSRCWQRHKCGVLRWGTDVVKNPWLGSVGRDHGFKDPENKTCPQAVLSWSCSRLPLDTVAHFIALSSSHFLFQITQFRMTKKKALFSSL